MSSMRCITAVSSSSLNFVVGRSVCHEQTCAGRAPSFSRSVGHSHVSCAHVSVANANTELRVWRHYLLHALGAIFTNVHPTPLAEPCAREQFAVADIWPGSD